MHRFRQLLSLFIVFTMLAPYAHAKVGEDKDILSISVKRLRTFRTYDDAVIQLRKTNPETANHLEAYLKSKNSLRAQLPPYAVEGKAVVIGSGKEVKLTVLDDQRIVLSIGKEKRYLSNKMTFKDLVSEVESLVPKTSSSVLNFIVSDAHAAIDWISIIAIGAIVVGLLAIFEGIMQIKEIGLKRQARAMKAACESGENLSLEELAETFNLVADFKRKHCPRELFIPSSTCGDVDITINCLQRRIDNTRLTNNSNRTQTKDIQFNSESNRYIITPRASQQ